jgi:hypothetical protein
VNGNDGRCNILRVVDDLIHTRDTLCDVHTGNTGKMECLEGHLSGWLTDTLSSNGTDCLSRFHNALVHLFDINLEKIVELLISDSVKTVL